MNWYTEGMADSASVLPLRPDGFWVCGCGFFGLSFFEGVNYQHLMVMTMPKGKHSPCVQELLGSSTIQVFEREG
jgi:hypothetical protein